MPEIVAVAALGWPAWLTFGVILAVLALLATDKTPPDLTLLSAVVVLMLAGVLSPRDALRGFANETLLTIAALLVVAEAVRKTGALTYVVRLMSPTTPSVRAALLRTMIPSAALSSVMNNTAVVAILGPLIRDRSRSSSIPPSRLLIPLAYASTLGGLITLIGTSTNLVVSGLLIQSGARPLGMFELTPVGLAAAAAGILYLTAAGPRVLAGARDHIPDRGEIRSYHFELRVPHGSPLEGVSVENAGLRALQGAFLAHIHRGGEVITLIEPDQRLKGGDLLAFVGNPRHLDDLLDEKKLIRAVDHDQGPGEHPLPLFEAVVAPESTLVGRTLRDADFRSRFQAVVLGIHRRGQRLTAPLGRTRIEAGDLLLVEARPQFELAAATSGEFYMVAPLGRTLTVAGRKAPAVLLLLLGIVVAAGTGALPVVTAAFAAAIIAVVIRAISPQDARRSVDVSLLIAIASGFALAHTIEQTGLARALAQFIVAGLHSFGPVAVLAAVYVATNLLTELLSNNAAAALIFPVAAAAAAAAGADIRPFAVAVAVAASAAFILPTGYQTYLMVMGLGGYRFRDFIRTGLPLNFLIMAVAIPLIVSLWM